MEIHTKENAKFWTIVGASSKATHMSTMRKCRQWLLKAYLSDIQFTRISSDSLDPIPSYCMWDA